MKTDETFVRRQVTREEIPLQFWTNEAQSIEATFAFSPDSLVSAQDWLGVENLRKNGESWTACVTLPNDDALVKQILALGAGVKVLSPPSLRERVKQTAQEIARAYL